MFLNPLIFRTCWTFFALVHCQRFGGLEIAVIRITYLEAWKLPLSGRFLTIRGSQNWSNCPEVPKFRFLNQPTARRFCFGVAMYVANDLYTLFLQMESDCSLLFQLLVDGWLPVIPKLQMMTMTLTVIFAAGVGTGYRVLLIPSSWFGFPAGQLSLLSLGISCQTCLGRIKQWLVYRLTTASHCKG